MCGQQGHKGLYSAGGTAHSFTVVDYSVYCAKADY